MHNLQKIAKNDNYIIEKDFSSLSLIVKKIKKGYNSQTMKKFKTLSFRFGVIFVTSLLIATIAGAVTTYLVLDNVVENYTNARLTNSVVQSSDGTDDDLKRAEMAVEQAQLISENAFKNKDELKDKDKVNASLPLIESSFAVSSKAAKEVCAYWIIINPVYTNLKITDPSGDGFYYVKDEEGSFVPKTVTNILQYSDSDSDHIGWWLSINKKQTPVWTDPYYNANAGYNIFSYIRPIFSSDNSFIGAVGIDMKLSALIDSVTSIKEYKDAYGVILNKDKKVVYMQGVKTIDDEGKYIGSVLTFDNIEWISDLNVGEDGIITYRSEGRRRTAGSVTLTNEMTYGISVQTGELRQPVRIVVFIPVLVYIALAIVLMIVIHFLMKRYLDPLKELTLSVKKVEDGDLDFKLEKVHDDEIGHLTTSFSSMVSVLKQKNGIISAMAYKDGLTGVKNKNAQDEIVKRIDRQITDGKAEFAVVMMDVNNLKTINDTQGHEAGDVAIRGACFALCNAFKHSPVYRIGGDEFIVILERFDYKNRDEIFANLKDVAFKSSSNVYGFSIGLATYEKGKDQNFMDVFNRADSEMYIMKKEMKVRKQLCLRSFC